MAYSDQAFIRCGAYSGSAEVTYEENGRITLTSKGAGLGGRIVGGVFFGGYGGLVADQLASGRELASFYASEVSRVKLSESGRNVDFYFYNSSGSGFCMISLERGSQLYRVFQHVFGGGGNAPSGNYGGAAYRARGGNAVLYLQTGPLAGQSFRLAPGSSVTVGRDSARCGLPLPQYGGLSGAHCRIEVGNGQLRVTDLNSRNGTCVNGVRLAPGESRLVASGGTVSLANGSCVLKIGFA